MNKATRITVATLGIIFGLSGMNHGFFEILHGNIPADGLFISAIGDAQKMWPHGNELAFTLIPNFLVTGIVAMMVGFAIIIWSLGFVHRKNGSFILILLFLLLLLVGGGVAQVLFFPWIWLVSTRINASLGWWRKILPLKFQTSLGKLWSWSLIISATLFLFVFEIGVTGFVPTVNDPDVVLWIMLSCLAVEVVALPLTFVSGFAYDIKMRPSIILGESHRTLEKQNAA